MSSSRQQIPEAVIQAFRQAIARQQAGDLVGAAELYRQCLSVCPDHVDSLANLGSILRQQGESQAGVAMLVRACSLDHHHTGAHFNLANSLSALGLSEEAIALYRNLLKFSPTFVAAWYNLALLLKTRGHLAEAEAAYREAIRIDPDHREARLNLADLLSGSGRLSEASAELEILLQREPNWGSALNNLAVLRQSMGEHGHALALLQRVCEVSPELPQPRSNLLFGMQYDPSSTVSGLRQAAAEWGGWAMRRVEPSPVALDESGGIEPPLRPLRVGYVSGDLCMHPVGFFLKDVLAAHDPRVVLPFVYSNGITADWLTDEIREIVRGFHTQADADGWREVSGLDDRTLAAQIRRDRIDLLVDLSGHTDKTRLLVFAMRPARVQISWLGYFATTGLPEMDFVILDPYHAPEGAEAQFTEQIIRLPHNRFCYTPFSFGPEVSPPPFLQNGCITFGSFNNTAKLNDTVLDTWAQILRGVPESRLILKWRTFADAPYCERIQNFFAERGVGPSRLELRPASSHQELLEQYADIDIALDPFPFSGGYTSCEALWMGVPVVTLPQERVVSRQTWSFLSNIGLPELAAADAESYVALAVTLADSRARLQELRATLRERMRTSVLCDASGFTRLLEEAYRKAWPTKCPTGLTASPPASLSGASEVVGQVRVG